MVDTLGQASQAVAQGAGYITIFSGTNDVCGDNASSMTSATDFGNQLRATLQRLTSGLPAARVLVLSIPNWYGLWESYRTNPRPSPHGCPQGLCAALLGGAASDSSRQAVKQRTIDLNAAIASVCGEFPACRHDHGAVYGLDFPPPPSPSTISTSPSRARHESRLQPGPTPRYEMLLLPAEVEVEVVVEVEAEVEVEVEAVGGGCRRCQTSTPILSRMGRLSPRAPRRILWRRSPTLVARALCRRIW